MWNRRWIYFCAQWLFCWPQKLGMFEPVKVTRIQRIMFFACMVICAEISQFSLFIFNSQGNSVRFDPLSMASLDFQTYNNSCFSKLKESWLNLLLETTDQQVWQVDRLHERRQTDRQTELQPTHAIGGKREVRTSFSEMYRWSPLSITKRFFHISLKIPLPQNLRIQPTLSGCDDSWLTSWGPCMFKVE